MPRFRSPSAVPLSARVLACAAIVVLAACALVARPGNAPRAAAAGDCTINASLDADELAFLTLINNYRAQNGLQPLKVSYTLSRASAWKSKDMAINAYFAHDDLSRTWIQRVRDCGYGFNAYIGENIAAGYGTAQAVFDGWKASPGHNANMLGANYTTIGIGKYVQAGSPYGTYWTTDFGSFSDGWVDALDDPAPLTTPSPLATPPTGDAPAPSPRGASNPQPLRIARPWAWWEIYVRDILGR
jgi:uncharacterized protein YkwD